MASVGYVFVLYSVLIFMTCMAPLTPCEANIEHGLNCVLPRVD